MNRLLVQAANLFGLVDFCIDVATERSCNYSRNWKRVKKDGYLPLPTYLQLFPTKKCNLHCSVCWQRTISAKERAIPDLDYVDIVKIVENAGNIKVGCVVGGEIFTRPDMMDILHYMDDKGIYLKISTNGYHLTDRMILDIARLKHVANIAVSIDGTQDMHNRLRGRPDAFQQTVAATRKFKNLGLKVLGCTVLMPENVMTIRDILEVFNELKVDRVTLHPMSYGRAGEFEKVQKRVDFTKLYAQKKAADYTPLTLNQMENVKAAMEIYRRKGLFCVLYPAHAMNNTEGFLNDTVGNKFICKQFYSATVNERGEVLPCLYMSKSFGNLLEKPMSEIWNSKDARDFRKSFANDGAFPYCYRCCSARII